MSVADGSIYISTGAFQTSSLDEMLGICDELKFYHIELSSGLPWSEHLDADIRTVRNKCQCLVHNYFPPPEVPFVLNLAAKDPEILRRTREHCQHAIALSAELGAPFFSVHSGFAFEARPSQLGGDLRDAPRIPLAEAREIFIDSLRLLCDLASRHHVGLAIENNVVTRMNLIDGKNLLLLGATADDLLELCDAVHSDALGLLIDVGHLHVTAGALSFDERLFLRRLESRIVAFHLNDNDGLSDSNQIFDQNAWFIPELRRFRNRTMVIESYALSVTQLKEVLTLVRSL
jgi:sugar phosphate isomerase/epimerase